VNLPLDKNAVCILVNSDSELFLHMHRICSYVCFVSACACTFCNAAYPSTMCMITMHCNNNTPSRCEHGCVCNLYHLACVHVLHMEHNMHVTQSMHHAVMATTCYCTMLSIQFQKEGKEHRAIFNIHLKFFKNKCLFQLVYLKIKWNVIL